MSWVIKIWWFTQHETWRKRHSRLRELLLQRHRYKKGLGTFGKGELVSMALVSV